MKSWSHLKLELSTSFHSTNWPRPYSQILDLAGGVSGKEKSFMAFTTGVSVMKHFSLSLTKGPNKLEF
jgi:hypothetical protein